MMTLTPEEFEYLMKAFAEIPAKYSYGLISFLNLKKENYLKNLQNEENITEDDSKTKK